MTNAIATGNHIEDIAEQYLVSQGFSILHRNFHCRMGEIDIICRNKEQLVFAEVRYRKNMAFGGPAASINYRKKHKLRQTAKFYLHTRSWAGKLYSRFDVLAYSGAIEMLAVDWLKNVEV